MVGDGRNALNGISSNSNTSGENSVCLKMVGDEGEKWVNLTSSQPEGFESIKKSSPKVKI